MLSIDDFKHVVKHAPLFSIDLVVLNEKFEMLVGLRKNEPAKGYWFVPGGRVCKDETLAEAFRRISKAELGQTFERECSRVMGFYEHLYQNSCFDDAVSTHYINVPHLLMVIGSTLMPPREQHDEYRWVAIAEVKSDETIHHFSKVFLDELLAYLNPNT